jgi:hypothetical protein
MKKIAFIFGGSKGFGYSYVKKQEKEGYNLLFFEDPRRDPQNLGRGAYVPAERKPYPEKYLEMQELLKTNRFTSASIQYSKNDILEICFLNFTELHYYYSIWLERKDTANWNILEKNTAPVQWDFEREDGLIKLIQGEQKTFKLDLGSLFSTTDVNGLFRLSFNFQYKCYSSDEDFERKNYYVEFVVVI